MTPKGGCWVLGAKCWVLLVLYARSDLGQRTRSVSVWFAAIPPTLIAERIRSASL